MFTPVQSGRELWPMWQNTREELSNLVWLSLPSMAWLGLSGSMFQVQVQVVVQSLSCVWLFVTPWTAAGQASLSFSQSLLRTHVHWIGDAIQPSNPLSPPSPRCLQSFPAPGSFPVRHLFSSGYLSIRASASASVLPMKVQGWFPLGLIGFISL